MLTPPAPPPEPEPIGEVILTVYKLDTREVAVGVQAVSPHRMGDIEQIALDKLLERRDAGKQA